MGGGTVYGPSHVSLSTDTISGCFGAIQIGSGSTSNATLARFWACAFF